MYNPYYQYHFTNGTEIKCYDCGEYRLYKDAVKESEKERKKHHLSDDWKTVITSHCRFE